MSKEFDIDKKEVSVVLSNDNNSIRISKLSNDDIYFSTSSKNSEVIIDYYSQSYEEWQSYLLFSEFMNRLVGRYVLRDPGADKMTRLPDDFVNIEEKTITCHSDDTNDSSTLRLTFLDNNKIKVALSRKSYRPAKIKISSRDSMYADYYRDFKRFYEAMSSIAPEAKDNDVSIKKLNNKI